MYERSTEEQNVIVAINFTNETQSIKAKRVGALSLLVNSFLDRRTECGADGFLRLRPNEAAVFETLPAQANSALWSSAMTTNYEIELRYADAIRTMINNETALVVSRMNWMIVAQGLLFSATGALQAHRLLIGVLAAIGICFALSMRRELKFSERAIAEILKRWDDFKETRTPDQLAAMPPAFAGGRAEVSWSDRALASRRMLPVLLCVSWLAVAVVLIVKW